MSFVEVQGVRIEYRQPDGRFLAAVHEASFRLDRGRSLGIVGESGSGKSTLARVLLGHCRAGGRIAAGSVRVGDTDVLTLDEPGLRRLRGGAVAFVPQNPLSSLTPHLTVGSQVAEAVRLHRGIGARAAREATLELFSSVNLPDPVRLYGRYPHELSGGQRQRVVISAALAGHPQLVVLDEPTTALDKTTEVQVLELVRSLRDRLDATLVYVSHDLSVISEMCDDVLVMLDGRVVEHGPTASVYRSPREAYTRQLVAAVPRADRGGSAPGATAAPQAGLLSVTGLVYRYPSRGGFLGLGKSDPTRPAVDGLSLSIAPGETLGLVGESGSGKSTAAAVIAGLLAPSAGVLRFDGESMPGLAARRSPAMRRRIQIIFQDPLSSLNPRQRVADILCRPLSLFHGLGGRAARNRAAELLAELQLDASLLESYPRQLSGGQQQRVAIARAFAAQPDLIICDEITSALDVSVQAQVLTLLKSMQARSGTACLFISHDLGVIRQLASRVIVLRDGQACESGPTAEVFRSPANDYTRLLIDAATRGYANLPDPAPEPAPA